MVGSLPSGLLLRRLTSRLDPGCAPVRAPSDFERKRNRESVRCLIPAATSAQGVPLDGARLEEGGWPRPPRLKTPTVSVPSFEVSAVFHLTAGRRLKKISQPRQLLPSVGGEVTFLKTYLERKE